MTKSKIKINPVTMEIEIEVSDSFLAKYFERLTNRFPKSRKLTPKIKSIKTKTKPTPIKKRGSIQEGILARIKKGNSNGVSVSEIVKSTGLDRKQIYNVVKIFKTKGIIKTTGRGNYIFDK
jgi:predicted DNA-binding transcriptional regulator AlpA